MSISHDLGYGDLMDDLDAQYNSSQERKLEPANPAEFMKWIQESVRTQNAAFRGLKDEHKKLTNNADVALIGITRLKTVILAPEMDQLNSILDLHRNYIKGNQNIGYTLQKCQDNIQDIIMNYQLTAETLNSPLADCRKKIAVQQELGLRLDDLDRDLGNCQGAVRNQAKLQKELAESLQCLMNKAGAKLPPKLKEDIDREDRVKQIALTHRTNLETGNDDLNTTPGAIRIGRAYPAPLSPGSSKAKAYPGHFYNPANNTKIEIATPITDASAATTTSAVVTNGGEAASLSNLGDYNLKTVTTISALVIGVIIGILIFFRKSL